MRAAAGEAETVALLECPAFGIHGEFHLAGEYEARFFELYTNDGEEAGLVLSGKMKLTVDAESWTLKQGDSFRFASRRPHRFGNPSPDAKAVVLWVNCVSAAR